MGAGQVESEVKAFFDNSDIYGKRLDTDWNNALTKQRFIKVQLHTPYPPLGAALQCAPVPL